MEPEDLIDDDFNLLRWLILSIGGILGVSLLILLYIAFIKP